LRETVDRNRYDEIYTAEVGCFFGYLTTLFHPTGRYIIKRGEKEAENERIL
jgi:hypothetical protein